MYPPIFKKLFSRTFGEGASVTKYNPALNVGDRTGAWIYMTQTDPADGFVCFKLFPEIGTRIPFLSPIMPDAILQPIIRKLQTNSYIAEATKIIAGAVPFLKDTKASVKDSIALDPTTLGKFLQLVKSALPDAIKVVSAPLEDIAAVQFDGNNDLYDSYLSTSASSSGINSRLIYSKDRQNILETTLSMNIDENILRPVYHQFENILEYWVNKLTKKYKFKFIFEGFETKIDRDYRFDRVMKLSSIGLVLPQKFASAMNMSPFDLEAMMQEAKATGFVDRLTPIIASAQMSGGGNGRPQKPESDLTDSGSDTRTSGVNEEKQQE